MMQVERFEASSRSFLVAGADRESTITQHLGLVYHAAGHLAGMVPRGFDYEDLVAFGTLGLIQAVDRYDPARGTRFASFAMPRIRGSILDAIQAQTGVPRRARARAITIRRELDQLELALGRRANRNELEAALGREAIEFLQQVASHLLGPLSLDAILDDPEQGDLDALASPHQDDDVVATVVNGDEVEELHRAFEVLGAREQEILRQVYAERQPLATIAVNLGISQGRVSQLRDRAVQRLRTLLERGGPAPIEQNYEPASTAQPPLQLWVA